MDTRNTTIRFGGEIELQTGRGTASTVEAQLLFLQMIAIHRREVVDDLLRLVNIEDLQALEAEQPEYQQEVFDFFALNVIDQSKFSIDIEKRYGIAETVRNTPIFEFVKYVFARGVALDKKSPTWSEIRKKRKARNFCAAISDWAEKWNLADEWVLDFAVIVFHCFKTNFLTQFEISVKNGDFDEAFFLPEFWKWFESLQGWTDAINSLSKDVFSGKFVNSFDENPPVFNFQKKRNFVFGSGSSRTKKQIKIIDISESCLLRSESERKFKERVTAIFEAQLRDLLYRSIPVTGFKTEFRNKLATYLAELRDFYRENSQKTPRKNSGEEHFRWLIEFQIPPVKPYSKIAREKDKDVKTVRLAIENVADLLGLTLRHPSTGRPKGAKDTAIRAYRR